MELESRRRKCWRCAGATKDDEQSGELLSKRRAGETESALAQTHAEG